MFNFLKKRKVVVTHDGSFHTDDVFAVATLSIYYEGRIKVIRTRDEEKIKKADIVLDVGGIYNPNINRFDHHQKEGAGTRDGGVPFASFGLIWKHFGLEICGKDEEVFRYIDERVCAGVDAADNGFDIQKDSSEKRVYEIGAIVGAFNPNWEEGEDEYPYFIRAVDFARGILEREIKSAKAQIKGRRIIEQAYKNSPDKRIVEIDQTIPRYLFQSVLSETQEALFLIEPSRGGWKAECIRISPNTYESRNPFKKEWGALREEELRKVTGVPDATFCHRGNFLCIAKSKEGVLKLVRESLI